MNLDTDLRPRQDPRQSGPERISAALPPAAFRTLDDPRSVAVTYTAWESAWRIDTMTLQNRRFAVRPAAAVLCLVGALLCVPSPVRADPPVYRAEVYPPLEGFDWARPIAFTESGVIVGYAPQEACDSCSAAVATAGDMLVELPTTAEHWNRAEGVNEFDVVVGRSDFSPYKWDQGVGSLLIIPPGYLHGVGRDVNNAGMVCGNIINDLKGFDLPVYWPTHAGDLVMLPGINGWQQGVAHALNEAGQIAGSSSNGGPFFGARWDDPALEPVQIGPLPGGHNSELHAINSQGDTAGRSAFPNNNVHALLHLKAADDLIDLGVLGGGFPFSEAFGVNDQLQVVGASTTDTDTHGFLWQEGAMHDLNDLVVATNEPFERISRAAAINNSSHIAAEAVMDVGFKAPRRIVLLTPCADLNCPADLSADCHVEAFDLAMLLGDWGPCDEPCTPGDPADTCPADLNGDCVVEAFDLAILLGAWGACP